MTTQKFKKTLQEKTNRSMNDMESIDTQEPKEKKSEFNELKDYLKQAQEEKTKLTDKVANLEKAQDIIFEQFRSLEFGRLDLELQQKKLEEASEKFRARTIDLFGKMTDLKKAKKTISVQNEKLKSQQEVIIKHQVLLESSNEKFRERTLELFGKMTDLKKAKKIINVQKQEIENHREQLKALNASKDKFFSIIAHDLRNPIAGFLNLTEILSANFSILSEVERIEFIDVMHQASKQLYNLLENLLQWSRSQTGGISYNPQLIPLKTMVQNAIETMMVNVENKKLKINVKIDDHNIVFVDENMITTVIRNLISNAIKFSRAQETIHIRSKENGNFFELSIIDQGVGMSQDTKEKLFRIDHHITTQGTADEKGSGLGLILCKEFVGKNGGKIWVESELNKGSEFIFSIPKS